MRSIVHKTAIAAVITLAISGCNVSDGDIEHWKHTQRGPRKITTVLVENRYDQAMRVHAARALIEMKHPNANGLELLQSAFQSMAPADREPIIHALVGELRTMLGPTQGASAQAPTEQQIKAKDAAYVILRGDGRSSFASGEDRAALTTLVLDWILSDFNTRALAGSYTAEQVVQAIGPTAVDRLTQSIAFSETSIPVVVEIAKLVNGIGTPQGKQAATARIVAVATEIEAPAADQRLGEIGRALLTRAQRPTDAPAIARAVTQLRTQYLTVIYEAIRTLGQPNGTDYLLGVANSATAPLDRKKLALTAMANNVSPSHAARLITVLNCTPGPACDGDLRGLAVDRLGEARDRTILPQLFAVYDASNGGAADQSFTLRWKLGEAILKLGGAQVLAEFMQHFSTARPTPFAGYTFAELNGEAQALGDLTPPPRDAIRGYLVASHPVPARVLAMMYLGIKGEQSDLALLQQYASEATPVTGEGWTDAQLTTVGAVATRMRGSLEQALRRNQNAAAPTP